MAVTPYGITRVTANGAVIYQHEVDTSHVLVNPIVAAQMTDLLQTTVATGTGKAAQIGRPVAGKTGTTTANKDGWFIGFSSGLTTGVWMGRDDAKVVPGLHGVQRQQHGHLRRDARRARARQPLSSGPDRGQPPPRPTVCPTLHNPAYAGPCHD